MKNIIYKTNPLIESTRPEIPFLASDGTECASLEEVDMINRRNELIQSISAAMSNLNQAIKDTITMAFEELLRYLILNNVSLYTFKSICEKFKEAKKKGVLTSEFARSFEDALLNSSVICITDQDVAEFNQIKAELQNEELEPTSSGRK